MKASVPILALGAFGLAAWTGCVGILLPNRAPLARLELSAESGGDCLFVLLPGRFGSPKDFSRADFSRWARERKLTADLVAVDTHIGYYRDRSVVERIHRDVVVPARAAGYREIWIAGVSMGGLGSLLYAREHSDELAGVLALAPYLGDDDLLAEIRSQGGPQQWSGGAGVEAESIEGLWQWLQQHSATASRLPLYLGFATEDALAPADRLLAELLPEERVFTTEGGHNWRAWAELWRQFLDTGSACRAPEVSL